MNSASNSLSETMVGQPVSPIEGAVSDILGSLERINDTLGLLERRFGSVLTPAPPSPAGATGGPKEVTNESELLVSLNMVKRRADLSYARLMEIIDRAQL